MNQSTEQQRRIAREYLLRVKDDMDRVKRTRFVYIENARKYGCTFREIGDLLGVTEGAVRYMLKQGEASVN